MFEPGLLANIDTSDRLCIPVNVLRAIKWWSAENVDVIADIVQAGGLIRVYQAIEALPRIDALRDEIAALPADLRFERLAALSDRYRQLKLYADGRLRFTKEVAQILGFALGEQPTLFVQPFPKGLEVMSLAFRAERLARNSAATSIGLYQQELD